MPDYDLDATVGVQQIRALGKGMAAFAAQVREDVNFAEGLADKASVDLLTESVRQIDKDLWFLDALLQSGR